VIASLEKQLPTLLTESNSSFLHGQKVTSDAIPSLEGIKSSIKEAINKGWTLFTTRSEEDNKLILQSSNHDGSVPTEHRLGLRWPKEGNGTPKVTLDPPLPTNTPQEALKAAQARRVKPSKPVDYIEA
jgi:hypothetical protein